MPIARHILLAIAMVLILLSKMSVADISRIVVPDGTNRSYVAGNRTLDMLFQDGSSLLLGPGAEVAVRAEEQITLHVTRAVLRIAAGQPGRARQIDMITPTARIRLSDGAAVLDVTDQISTISMLLPGSLTIEAAGRTGQLYRAGFTVTADADRLGRARRAAPGKVAEQLNRIAPGLGARETAYNAEHGQALLLVTQASQTPDDPLPGETNMELAERQGECADGEASVAGAACDDTDQPFGAAFRDAALSDAGLLTTDVVAGIPTPVQPDPLENYSDGFGGLGLADLDDPSQWLLSSFAAAGTSISDDRPENTPTTFQVYGEPFYAYDLEDAQNNITGFAYVDGIVDFVTDSFTNFENFFDGSEADFLLRGRSAGPTTTVVLPGVWETDYDPGGNDTFNTYQSQTDSDQLVYIYGTPGEYPYGSSDYGMIALTGPITSSSFSGRYAYRRADNETTSLGNSIDTTNIFRLASVRSAVIYETYDEDIDLYYYDVVDYSNDNDGVSAGYALDYGGPFNGRDQDNFLLIESVEVQPVTDASGLDPDLVFTQFGSGFSEDPDGIFFGTEILVLADTRSRYAVVSGGQKMIFATGDLDAMLYGDADMGYEYGSDLIASTVDHFYLNTGLQTAFETSGFTGDLVQLAQISNSRAFLPALSWTDLFSNSGDIADVTGSPLYVAHPATPVVNVDGLAAAAPGSVVAGGADSRLLHLDFGLTQEDGRQVSSISATLGEVDYRLYLESQSEGYTLFDLIASNADTEPVRYLNYSVDALLSASTVGSSNDGQQTASTLWQSDWISSAAGGGNPFIGTGSGQLGFFVLQNAGPRYDDVAIGSGDIIDDLSGGLASPMGDDPVNHPDVAFSALRLGIGVAADQGGDRTGAGFIDGLEGYATAFVEAEIAGADTVGLYPGTRIDDGPNLVIYGLNQNDNTLSASLNIDNRTIGFGADSGALSTYADDLSWGLLSSGDSKMALASLDPVASELRGQFTTSSGAPVPIPGSSNVGAIGDGSDAPYSYVQWGAFFGDTVTTDQARRHVHLGSFAAASPIDRSVLDTASGQATYKGHAIGNVYNAGEVYSAAGQYSDTFDFDRRRGQTMLDFDGRAYTGNSRLDNGRYSARVTAGDRAGSMNGQFGGGTTNGRPNAVVGGFEIANSSTDPNSAYRASGTFAGEVGR